LRIRLIAGWSLYRRIGEVGGEQKACGGAGVQTWIFLNVHEV
jgi:hypothetical protein